MAPGKIDTSDSPTPIEELLPLLADIGVEGSVLFGEILIIYFAIGVVATAVLGLHTPYPFLSTEADPILLITSTTIGLFMIQAAGSLLLYHAYDGIDSESLWSVMLSFIALGIGGSLLQITLPDAWELLSSHAHVFWVP